MGQDKLRPCFYVYLLKSLKDKELYIGQTANLEKRFREHNNKVVKSTKHRTPFVLMGYRVFETRSEARWFEKQVKGHSDKKNKFVKELLARRDVASGS